MEGVERNGSSSISREKKKRRREGDSTCSAPCQTQVDSSKPLLRKKKKKRRRKEGDSTCAPRCQAMPIQVDSFKPLLRKKKKRRRKEGDSTCSTACQAMTTQVDSVKPLLGFACAGLGKKKKRSKGLQIEPHHYDPSGEASSENEKQSLLAWVEKGMQAEDYGNTMKDSKGCSLIGQFLKAHGHTHHNSNGEPNQTEMCISAPFTYDFMADCEGTKACSSDGHSFHSHNFESAYNRVCDTQGEILPPCLAHVSTISNSDILSKEVSSQLITNGSLSHKNKREKEVDKVLDYVVKRCVVVKTLSGVVNMKPRTTKTVVIAWERSIPVTLTSEACVVEEWITSQNGDLFGLDVEWRPNRLKGQRNKVALLQLSNGDECLIIQMLFLDRQPQALRKLLADPLKGLAGVGVFADGKRLLQDYGLECQGGVELTTLAVERLKREELRNVGLKVLVQEVLGLVLEKPKRVTLSNWAKEKLDQVQINYACLDAWASFALSKRLLVQA